MQLSRWPNSIGGSAIPTPHHGVRLGERTVRSAEGGARGDAVSVGDSGSTGAQPLIRCRPRHGPGPAPGAVLRSSASSAAGRLHAAAPRQRPSRVLGRPAEVRSHPRRGLAGAGSARRRPWRRWRRCRLHRGSGSRHAVRGQHEHRTEAPRQERQQPSAGTGASAPHDAVTQQRLPVRRVPALRVRKLH